MLILVHLFAKLVDQRYFEITYNINANKKFYFNNLTLNLPTDFQQKNFDKIIQLFDDLKGKHYSINKIEDILDEIDKITLNEEFENIKADVNESINDNLIDLSFNIKKDRLLLKDKYVANNITRENVIRNQFESEGEFYNEILEKKTINNLKNLGFFKNVNSDVVQGSNVSSKIINITVEEKPTGEIMAGAGVGTNGGSVMFSVKKVSWKRYTISKHSIFKRGKC